jgi:hypothetical protein
MFASYLCVLEAIDILNARRSGTTYVLQPYHVTNDKLHTDSGGMELI